MDSNTSQAAAAFLELKGSVERELSQTTYRCLLVGKEKISRYRNEERGPGLAPPLCVRTAEKALEF